MIKKILLLLYVGLVLSSCFAIHPELQNAKSVDTGAHRYSIGVFGGANVLVETYGVAGVYNYGLTDKMDWSTDGSFSVQASSLKRVFQGFGVNQYNPQYRAKIYYAKRPFCFEASSYNYLLRRGALSFSFSNTSVGCYRRKGNSVFAVQQTLRTQCD